MFGTTTIVIISSIIALQLLLLFAQALFYLSRPKDKSRWRFLLLILAYIIYNIFAELLWAFPKDILPLDTHSKYLIATLPSISVPLYFAYYCYKEFNIGRLEIKAITKKRLSIAVLIVFTFLFAIPSCYICTSGFAHSVLFPPILIVSLIVIVKISIAFFRVYFNKRQSSKYYNYRILSGYFLFFTLSLIPSLLILSVPDSMRILIFNWGFVVMTIIHITDFIHQRQLEAVLLDKIQNKTNYTPLSIAPDIVQQILKHLAHFETNHVYLKRKITLHALAKQFGTNSKYLSQVINTHKGTSFTQYINDLRIRHTKNKLDSDDTFKYYTLKAMANEMGYISTEAFANAFLKREKVKVSIYVESIRKKTTIS